MKHDCRAWPNTAYALLGRKIFKSAGLADGKDYKLNPPWRFAAKDRGAKSLGRTVGQKCAIDIQGFRNMLSLRAEMEGQWGGVAPAPDKYIDSGFFDRALVHAR